MTKNQVHEWRDKLPEYEEKRILRGYWNSREWQVAVLDPESKDWVKQDAPSPELWISLRKTLWNKYLRRRVAYKMIERVDAILEGHGYTAEDLNRICNHGITDLPSEEDS